MELDIGRSVSYILIREYYIVGIPRHLRHGLCYCLLCCVASGSGDGESLGGHRLFMSSYASVQRADP